MKNLVSRSMANKTYDQLTHFTWCNFNAVLCNVLLVTKGENRSRNTFWFRKKLKSSSCRKRHENLEKTTFSLWITIAYAPERAHSAQTSHNTLCLDVINVSLWYESSRLSGSAANGGGTTGGSWIKPRPMFNPIFLIRPRVRYHPA